MDTCLDKKQNTEFNLGEEVVLQLTKDLDIVLYILTTFTTAPILIEKLFHKIIYSIRTVRKNRKQMPKMLEDKKMKTGDCEFFYSKNLIVCKWMDNR